MTDPPTAPLSRIPPAVPAPPGDPGCVLPPEPALRPESVAEDVVPPRPAVVADEEIPPEPTVEDPPWRAGARLIRFRVRADHHGLRLRAGESVLCVPYEPAELGMVVLVRCESDGHAPGALLSVRELDYVGEAGRHAGDVDWDEPGTRAWPAAARSWRPSWPARRRK
ncbi:hypothetical protein ACH9EU_14700 [Kocuria sp. M1R5S2]|uniref:hypothetical protein n=1 Tax=Kocuria rhizosphaerae TaxID=3376285 RepID=UPI0037AAC1EF